MMIRVTHGKGDRDRYTLLRPWLLEELRHYWKCYPAAELAVSAALASRRSRWAIDGAEDLSIRALARCRPAQQGRHSLPAPFLCHAPAGSGRGDHGDQRDAGASQPQHDGQLSARAAASDWRRSGSPLDLLRDAAALSQSALKS